MKLIHPLTAEVISKIIAGPVDGYVLSYALIVPFVLSSNGPMISESSSPVWPWVIAAMGENCLFDEAWPKARGEFLAYGAVYAKPDSVQPVSASIAIGALTKQLAVFGERHEGVLGMHLKPESFSRMPITPQTAYGGHSYPLNPLGKGFNSQSLHGSNLSELPRPNVESPSALIVSNDDHPEPAGFWAYPPNWPQRTKYLGVFDDDWVKNRWPHLPYGTASGFYQAAPEDQQVSGFFQGDEKIEIHNMHPRQSLIESTLPGVRARVFAQIVAEDGRRNFKEFKANAETVWLFPENLAGLMLFRAVIPVQDDSAQELEFIYTDLENIQQTPFSVDVHYENYLIRAGRKSPVTI